MKIIAVATLSLGALLSSQALASELVINADSPSKLWERNQKSVNLFEKAFNFEKTLPASVLARTECLAVLPGVKEYGVIVGGVSGEGYATCRLPGDRDLWSAPISIDFDGASLGLQIGFRKVDIIVAITNPFFARELKFGELDFDGARVGGSVGDDGSSEDDETVDLFMIIQGRDGLYGGAKLESTEMESNRDNNQIMYNPGDFLPAQILETYEVEGAPSYFRDLPNAIQEAELN